MNFLTASRPTVVSIFVYKLSMSIVKRRALEGIFYLPIFDMKSYVWVRVYVTPIDRSWGPEDAYALSILSADRFATVWDQEGSHHKLLLVL